MAIRGHQRQAIKDDIESSGHLGEVLGGNQRPSEAIRFGYSEGYRDIESSGHLGEVLLKDGHDSTEHLCAIRCTQIRQMCTQMHSDSLRDGHDSTEHRDVVDAF